MKRYLMPHKYFQIKSDLFYDINSSFNTKYFLSKKICDFDMLHSYVNNTWDN